jgi:hypothetical protein
MAGQTLDLLKVSDRQLKHQTIAKVVTGAVLVTYDVADASGSTAQNTVMLESMTEPQERTLGAPQRVNVLHLLHPLEVIAPAYDGGDVTLTLIETWDKTPYQELGFSGAKEFLDIINHKPFTITVATYKPDGGKNFSKLWGCRVVGPVIPAGPLARDTQMRRMNAPVAYTRLTRQGF